MNTHGRAREVTLIGRASDIATTKYQYAYFVIEIERLAGLSGYRGRSSLNAFRVGVAIGIMRALDATKTEAVRAASSSTALVLASRFDEAEAECKRRYPGIKTRQASLHQSDSSAYHDGVNQGKGVAQRESRARIDGKGTRALPEAT